MKEKAQHLIYQTAPVDWEKIADEMASKDMEVMVKELESIAERAGELAGYFDMRHGYGCGDQGHKVAVKNMHRVGKLIHCKAFGYNAYFDVTI